MVGFDWICHGNGTACSVIDGICNRERVLVTLPVSVTSRKRRLHPLPSLSLSLSLSLCLLPLFFNFLF